MRKPVLNFLVIFALVASGCVHAGNFYTQKMGGDNGIVNIQPSDVQVVGEPRSVNGMGHTYKIWISLGGNNDIGKEEANEKDLMSIIAPVSDADGSADSAGGSKITMPVQQTKFVVNYKTNKTVPIDTSNLQPLTTQKNLDVVEINSYTDSIGTKKYNKFLSLRRASYLKTYLITHGENAKIKTHGNGDADAIESNKTAAGRAANRRSEVVINPTIMENNK